VLTHTSTWLSFDFPADKADNELNLTCMHLPQLIYQVHGASASAFLYEKR
jgi:hypothetical protein